MLIANSPVYGVSATGVGYAVVEGLSGYPGSLSPDDIIRGVASFADEAAEIVENTITSRGLSRMCDIINMTRKKDIKDIDLIVDIVGLTKAQRHLLHRDITGMNYTLEEILEMAKVIKELYPNK